MATRDVANILDDLPMRRLQVAVVAIAIGLNALDGFDVLSISFASPGLAKQWNIDRAALGLVLSMELIGMAIGSIVLGGVADRVGRRQTVLGCLCCMASGMFLATITRNVYELSAVRVLTGFGIGGMLAAINALTAEFSNRRHRQLAMSLMVIGYPVGAALGGTVAAILLTGGEWRSVFVFGTVVTATFIPLVWYFVPESPAFLMTKQPPGALLMLNAALARMGHGLQHALPTIATDRPAPALRALFAPRLRSTTLIVTIAYFAHIMTFYFILKWIPKIVVDMGHQPGAAAGVLVWANIGGAIGGALFGIAARPMGLKRATITVLLLSFGMVTFFGQGQSSLGQLAMVAAAVGFCTNAGVVGLYSIFAETFPTQIRATGTGFAIGVGRGGAALAPAAAGALFQAGVGLPLVAALMAAGSLVAAVALLALRPLRNDPAVV
jgi:benzoate transport